ncbi:MAG: glycosyltransferase family 2 protein [Patescibacteria group bacterium]|nr:MAG: glycosyltransferase family 2 protein [Patescibacteria group bacterium]
MKKAIFTLVQNEKFFLPIWLKYYSRYFAPEDIYILDHNTSDGSTDNLKAKVIKLDYPGFFDHLWMNQTVKDFQKKLLNDYDVVVFVEADEILASVKEPDFAKAIDEEIKDKDYLPARGFEIIDKERSPLLPGKIIAQKHFGIWEKLYNKNLISKVALDWGMGFHALDTTEAENSNFVLIHLHRVDYQEYIKRKLNFAKKEKTKEHRWWGWQNKLEKEKDIIKYFKKDDKNLIKIPQEIRRIDL